MNIIMKIFTWWDGATIGTLLDSWRHGEEVGRDAQGNRYFRGRMKNAQGNERRWVIYSGSNDASRVHAEWHGWLHGAGEDVPKATCRRRASGKWTTRPMRPGRRPPIARPVRLKRAEFAPVRPATTKPGRPTSDPAAPGGRCRRADGVGGLRNVLRVG